MKINKNIVVTAAILGALTIIIGAFGAHALKELITEKSLVSFETGVVALKSKYSFICFNFYIIVHCIIE